MTSMLFLWPRPTRNEPFPGVGFHRMDSGHSPKKAAGSLSLLHLTSSLSHFSKLKNLLVLKTSIWKQTFPWLFYPLNMRAILLYGNLFSPFKIRTKHCLFPQTHPQWQLFQTLLFKPSSTSSLNLWFLSLWSKLSVASSVSLRQE